MPLTRRDFLEVSALSATGFALRDHPLLGEADQTAGSRVNLSLDYDWQFFRPEDGGGSAIPGLAGLPAGTVWANVDLPHTVRLEPRDVSGGRNYQGVCWYRKQLAVQPQWSGRVFYLRFEGAMQVADLWLNDVHLTTHYGGYLPFAVDLSKHLKYDGPNVLTVRLDNSNNAEVPPGKPQNALDFVYFGGLYRSVNLAVLDTLHITDTILANKVAGGGVFVTYPEVTATQATVQVQTDLINEGERARTCMVVQELTGADGTIVATGTQRVTLAAGHSQTIVQKMVVHPVKLWHPNDPNLYSLKTTIREGAAAVDQQICRVGIRRFVLDAQKGLLINGEPFLSIGANRHQDHPYVGYAMPPSAQYRDAYKLRDAGFTSYRSHYPQDPSFMDACDELGILAIVSNPGWQFVGDDTFKKRTYQNAREMIRRDRNHACVLMWEAALNESDNSTIAKELEEIVHAESPGPSTYSAGDPLRKPLDGFAGWDLQYGGFASFGRGYEAKDTTRPWWVREWGDQVDNWSDQQGRVRVARGWGETPMLVQALSHMQSLNTIYGHAPLPAGATLWAGIDAARGYHHQPFLGAPLDVFRLPKFDYQMFMSQRPPTLTPLRTGSGPMVSIANFASFHSPAGVTIFSNCEQVALYQNGKLVATQSPDTGFAIPHPPFTFKVGDFSATRTMLYSNGVAARGTEIGELRAEGLIAGKTVATHLVHSPGVPMSLRLELDLCGRNPVADGVDWVRVYAYVCDARGTTYPYADDRVTFKVSGEGSLIGDELANPVRAEAGIATGLVRTSKVPGKVTVTAAAPGLTESSVDFSSSALGQSV